MSSMPKGCTKVSKLADWKRNHNTQTPLASGLHVCCLQIVGDQNNGFSLIIGSMITKGSLQTETTYSSNGCIFTRRAWFISGV